MNKRGKTVEMKTGLTPENAKRLDKIIKDYNFRSRYQIIQYLIECFLSVADPQPEVIANKDIEEMFEGWETASTVDFDTTKRRTSI